MIIQIFDRAIRLMRKAPIKGDFVEFGVYRGNGIVNITKLAKKLGKIKFYGFDSFSGMPPTKIPLTGNLAHDYREGSFSDITLDSVKKFLQDNKTEATLIKAVFKNLKPLSHYGIGKVRFAHIDADIYEGYRDALNLLTPHLQIGTVIVFDEFMASSDYRYQGMRQHSVRAIREWEEKTKFNLHLIRFKLTTGLCVIVDEEYLKKYGDFIESLRADNIIQSLSDTAYQILHKANLL